MARISKNQVGALAKARTPARFEPPNRRRLSGPGLRAFLNIAGVISSRGADFITITPVFKFSVHTLA
jgi:hypothetical protein